MMHPRRLVVTAVKAAVQVGGAISLRLIPLNKDRAFVAAMLVRTAFELPDPEGEVMGVNTELDDDAVKGGCANAFHDIMARPNASWSLSAAPALNAIG